ncbi:MAG: succinate--CoA ligase subunit alpha [Acidimicrobiales bacterium]
MSVLLDRTNRVVVQGLTGNQGRFHGLRNRAYGTQVVAGVTPGRGGVDVSGVPVFNTMAEAVAATGVDTSVVFVPPPAALGAVMEAATAGIGLVVCITEGIALRDQVLIRHRLDNEFPVTRMIGPNCPGLITPGQGNVGIIPAEVATGGGPVGIVSRSGTLTYQAIAELTAMGLGQTTCIGIGGDPVPGTSFVDCLALFEADAETRAVVLIGEIGGDDEEEAAEFIESSMTTPVVAYVAGLTAPPGRRMGHAGAIVAGGRGGAAAKIAALSRAGAHVVADPTLLGQAAAEALGAAGGK